MRPTTDVYSSIIPRGLSDIAFSCNDSSRILASDRLGVNIWDRRMSDLPCLHLATNSVGAIYSIKYNVDYQVIFGAGQYGVIHMWDLRGGSSSYAFHNNDMTHYSPVTSLMLSSELEKIGSLKTQSNISKDICSIDRNPSCPYQLAFDLVGGWSGVFDVHNLQVTHLHCPPDWPGQFKLAPYMRRSTWLPVYSIYAVAATETGLHLLDFYHDHTSPCHVDYEEDFQDMATVNGQKKQNKYIALSEGVTACTAHPFYGAIVAGTEESSLLLLSQEFMPSREKNDSPIKM